MKEEMGLTGIDIRPLVTFRMNYGPNDNEISTLYRGVINPGNVKFDPIEIEAIELLDPHQLLEKISAGKESFCGWFLQMIRWAQGEDSDLQILRTHSQQPLFADRPPRRNRSRS
jgi:isopentenyldiphosphate isomerase